MQRPFGRTQTGRCHIVSEKETVIFNALQFEIYLLDCRRETVTAILTYDVRMKKLRSMIIGLASDDLLRHTAVLFSGMLVVHVCNLVYQMAVSRILPKREYALLAAFLGVLTIIQRPLATLTVGISHYSSLLRQEGRLGDVKRLLKKWLLLTGIPAAFFGGLSVVVSRELAGFLHLDRVAPVVIAGALLPALFWLPIFNGAGQGLQLFGWCSASAVCGALVRLGLGAGFVWFLYPACGWAMLGHGLGIYASAAILLLGLFLMLRGLGRSQLALPSMRFYLIQSFFIQAAYAVLMTADVVLVKHYLPGDTEFAYAATLGRLVVFLPGIIVTAMFPKVVSRGAGSRAQYQIFVKSLVWTAVFVLAAVLGCSVFSGLLARILFGIADAPVYLKRMIGMMSLVMGFSALLNVVLQFLLAQHRFIPAFSIVGFAGLYLAGAALFHVTAWQVITTAAVCNAGALFSGILAAIRPKTER
jgi:O-antigen/teichoic acid export membrane protein